MRFVQSAVFIALMGTFMGLGCQVIAGIEGTAQLTGGSSSSGMAGSGGASSSSSSSGNAGMGGAGGNAECVSVSDCKSTECKTAVSCTEGACVWNYVSNGALLASQLYGDCQDRICDGDGNVTVVNTSQDPTQYYKWSNPCYVDACNAPWKPMANDGAMCTTPWQKIGVCQAFKCIECTTDPACASGLCSPDGQCIAATCINGTKGENETDMDCGGPDCAPCPGTKACMVDTDCLGKCDNMVCAAPSCSDGIRNQDETDVDCGGSCAMGGNSGKCADFKKCLFPNDCASGFCKFGQCQESSCLDQIKNQDEEGIDCGGICPLACP